MSMAINALPALTAGT